MWYSGSTAMTRSAGVSSCTCETYSPPAITARCDSTTPLGLPVVPEVYIISASFSGATGGSASAAAPWMNSSASGSQTTMSSVRETSFIASLRRSIWSGATNTIFASQWSST